MNFSRTAIKRPVTTLMLMLIIVVLGSVSYTKLPLDLFPKMELPIAIVVVQYPNAAPTEVESMISKPLEQQIATVENLDSMNSISMDGSSIIIAQFQNGTDMNFATLGMREKVALISDYLPEKATEPMIMAMNPDMSPVMMLYVSGDMDLTELYNTVDSDLLSPIERSAGVAAASVFGGVESEIAVNLNQEKLAGYGLTISQISQMLAAENINLPSGDVDKGNQKLIVRTMGEFKNIDEIKTMPITLPTREVIYLQDLASIEEQIKEQTSIGRLDGSPAIGISITKQSTANTVEVSDNVNAVIEQLHKTHPDLKFTIAFDQADYIQDSVNNVIESALMGCLLAIIVVFFFLRNVASTAIIAISIPTSIIATFILMYFCGLTMNMLSLGGLAIGVGMLVDDSIVVLENISRLREEGYHPMDASLVGTQEVTMPVFAATMTKIAVFLPIVFVEGIASTMFKEFSYTIGFALLASLIVALSVVPMLCSKLFTSREKGRKPKLKNKVHYKSKLLPLFEQLMDFITEKYLTILRYSLRSRKKVLTLCLVLLVTSGALVGVVGGELFPASDEGSFTITAEMPFGTSLEDADVLISEIEHYVSNNIPELKDCAVSIGNTSSFSTSSANTSSVTVNLVDKTERDRSTEEVTNQARKDLSSITGAKLTFAESSMTGSMSGGSPIQISLKGDDLDTLRSISDDYIALLKDIKGTSNVKSDVSEGNPEVRVVLNRYNAASYGITSAQLAQSLESALSGSKATTLKRDGEEIDVTLSLNKSYGESVENMKQIMLNTPTGQTVTVGEIADFVYDNSPSQINRQDQVRTITITSDVSGRDLQSVSTDITKVLEGYPLPSGYSYSTGGEQQEMTDSFTSLAQALLLSLLLIYMILASQFESLVQPLIIMLAIPFALTGAFLALFITNTPLSMIAFLGIIMLAGIVVNNSILLIDFINQNRLIAENRTEAIVAAGRHRLRPIFMTMLTTTLGLLPLSLGIGSGGELQAPMGITVIGGLIFSTVITLIVVPVIYAVFDDQSLKRMARKELSYLEG